MNISRVNASKLWFPLIVALGMSLAIVKPGLAQSQAATATLTGTVTDPSDALMSGVHIELLNTQTQERRVVTSNASGLYTITNLPFGTYELTATSTGFSNVVISPIDLQVGQTASVNVTMQPGKVTHQIQVSGSALRLETATSTLDQVLTTSEVNELPTQSRNPLELVALMPGVTVSYQRSTDPSGNSSINDFGRNDFSAGGGPGPETSSVLLDGTAISFVGADNATTIKLVPSPDFVQEFSMDTSVPSPEYGESTSVVNMITKRGTNSLHGGAFEFNQNAALNANTFFNNASNVKSSVFNKNQFGAVAGGPVYLPHIYDGRNRTWFFGGFEDLDQRVASSTFYTIPTPAEMEGDFSGLVGLNGSPITLYNPNALSVNSSGVTVRQPFQNNQIPTNLIDPYATKVMSFYPKPNVPGGVVAANGVQTNINNFIDTHPTETHFIRYMVRGDQRISDNQQLMLRYERDTFRTPFVDVYGTPGTVYQSNGANASERYNNPEVSHTWMVSPTFVIQQSVSWENEQFTQKSPIAPFDPSQLGGPFTGGLIQAYADSYAGGSQVFPAVTVSGFSGLGINNSTFYVGDNGEADYYLNMTKQKGRHELKWGFNATDNFTMFVAGLASSGNYNYTGMFTQGTNPLVPTANTGSGLADFELGYPGSGNLTTLSGYTATSKYLAWYFNDNIKASSRLTLNLGIRYDIVLPFTDRYNNSEVVQPFVQSPIGNMIGPNTNGETVNQFLGRTLNGAVVWAASPAANGNRRLFPIDYSNVGPRVGFAYRLDDKTVVRGGWGRIYLAANTTSNDNESGNVANTPVVGSIDGIHPNVTNENPFPNGFQRPLGSSQGLLTNVGFSMPTGPAGPQVTPYINQWSLNIQRSLPGNSILSVAYAGTRGRRLTCQGCGDQLSLQTIQEYGSNLFNLVPNPFYGIITNLSAPLSAPMVQQGQLLKAFPQYAGGSIPTIPVVQGKNNWPIFDQTKMQYPFLNNWNALEVTYEIRNFHGMQTLVSYMWDKNLTDYSGNSYGPGITVQDLHNPMTNYSLFAEDVPSRLVISHVINLPVGRGKRFLSNANPMLDRIIGGWQANGVITLASGFPVLTSQTPNTLGNMYGTQRPNILETPVASSGSLGSRLNQWFANPTGIFATASPFTYGNAPPAFGSVRSDPEKNYDFSVNKIMKIYETLNFELHGDFFNVFNHPWFSGPNSTWGSSSFGVVHGLNGAPRYVQLGGRLIW